MPKISRGKITAKQQRFVNEYLIDLNAAQAAIRAGYSVRSASRIGPELLGKTWVAEAIAEAIEARAEKTNIDAQWVLDKLVDEVDADIADLYDDDGNLKPVREWPTAWRKGIVVGIEAIEEYSGAGENRKFVGMVRKVKLSDRIKHKELIGRHLGMFVDKSELRFPDGAPTVQVYLPSNGRDKG